MSAIAAAAPERANNVEASVVMLSTPHLTIRTVVGEE